MTPGRYLRVVRHRMRGLFQKHRLDAELGQELAFHFEELFRENLADGMTAEEALSAAARALGNSGLLADQCRDQRRVTWLLDLKDDIRHGWRMMRKNAGFTIAAAVSLTLGIGANTAILGAIDKMIFGNLPFAEAERIVMIRSFRLDNPTIGGNISIPDYFAIKDHSRSFQTIGCSLDTQMNLGPTEDGAPPERIYGQGISAGVFETLGARPLLGRPVADADYHAGPPTAIVLSHRLWQRRFGADARIIGKKVVLNGSPTEVIAVMPPEFRFMEERPEFWVPRLFARTSLQAGVRYQIVAARLTSGATMQSAQAELDNIAEQLALDFPSTHRGWGLRVRPVREALFGWMRAPLLTLEAGVVLVLLIACANVAGLLLARGASRRQELAMRAVLGAGRGRIVRQLLTESLMLSLVGAVLGLAVAWFGLHLFAAIPPPPAAPRLTEIPLNFRMLMLTGVTAIFTAIVFGTGPALAACRNDLTSTLKESSRGTGTPRVQNRWRRMLVSVQIAFAFVLLIGSSLLIKSYARLAGRDLNFEPRGLLTFEFRYPVERFLHAIGEYQGYPYMAVDAAPREKLERVLDRLHRVPGVESVAGISNPPINSLIVPSLAITVENSESDSGETAYFMVTPNLFATLRTPLVRGRDFDANDTAGAPWVAVINETAARRFWPGQDPIGKRFTLDSVPDDRPREVIGIVRDIPTRARSIDPEPVVYASYWQQPLRYRLPWATLLGQMTFIVRSSGDLVSLEPAVRKATAEVDPGVPLANITPMEQYTEGPIRDLFLYASALGVFAAVAASLAVMGIYAALSYAVAQRTHEIGIRMSVGARPRAIIGLVGQWTTAVLGIGLLAGCAGALALTRLLESQLWQVKPTDAASFVVAGALLTMAAVVSCVVPVKRALRVDPTVALRIE